MFYGFLQLGCLTLEICFGAAPFLTGFGRHFAAVDGKHLSADQAQVIANQQYTPEQMDDLFVHGGNEFGNGGEMGLGISGQGHENSIFLAGPFDLPAGDDASGVGGGSGDIILETFIKAGEIQLMINEMVQGIFEGTGENLLGKVNGNDFALSVGVRFVTSQAATSL